MSVIADKISSDSRNFLAGVKSSTAKNDRTLNSAMNLSMRLDGKEVELSDKRRKINAESFDAPQQIQDNFNEGYVGGYQFGVADGIAKGVELGRDSVLNPLDGFFKALPIAAVALLSQIPQLGNLLDIFLPDRKDRLETEQPNIGTGSDGGFGLGTYGEGMPSDPPIDSQKNFGSGRDGTFGLGTYGRGRPSDSSDSLPYTTNEDGEVVPVPQSSDTYTYPDGTTLSPGDTVGFDPGSMGGTDSNTQLVVMRQPIIVTKKEMGTVVNNGSQLAVIVSGDQRRSDFINFAQRIT